MGKGGWKRAIKAIHSKPDFLQRHCQLFYQFAHQRQGWVPSYQGSIHEETSDFASKNDPTFTQHCATFSPVTPIFYFTSAFSMSWRTFVQNLRKIYLIFLPRPRYYGFIIFVCFFSLSQLSEPGRLGTALSGPAGRRAGAMTFSRCDTSPTVDCCSFSICWTQSPEELGRVGERSLRSGWTARLSCGDTDFFFFFFFNPLMPGQSNFDG